MAKGLRCNHPSNTKRDQVASQSSDDPINDIQVTLVLILERIRSRDRTQILSQRSNKCWVKERIVDSQTGMLSGIPESARCVQRFDDSRNSAIHITYRISLRSSSLREPRDPLSKVVVSIMVQPSEPKLNSNQTE